MTPLYSDKTASTTGDLCVRELGHDGEEEEVKKDERSERREGVCERESEELMCRN